MQLTEEEQRRVDAFIQLSRIERGLRQFIEVELSRIDGPKWARTLPGDVKDKVLAGGLEATDFPDLKKALNSAWRKFGPPVSEIGQEKVRVHLEGLEPIRNDIAHSRNVSSGKLAMVQAAYYVLSPILNEHSSTGELPPTHHPQLILDRIRGALTHVARVDPSDLKTLDGISGGNDLRSAIEGYERVRNRPGRRQALLRETQSTALNAVDALLERMDDE